MRSIALFLFAALSPLQTSAVEHSLLLKPASLPAVIESIGEAAPPVYQLNSRRAWIRLETPYVRLARAVAEARQHEQPVGAHLGTAAVLAPVLRVIAGPETRGDADVKIEKLVAELPDGTSLEARIEERFTDLAQTRRRRGIKLEGVRAVLPLTALVPGVRFRVALKGAPEELIEPEPFWIEDVR